MYKLNKIGPTTEPCGTPYNSGVYEIALVTKSKKKKSYQRRSTSVRQTLRYPRIT